MEIFIIAYSLRAHILDENFTPCNYARDDIKSSFCGLRIYKGINTHLFDSVTIRTGKLLPLCKTCEKHYLTQHIKKVTAWK